jgi:hypothetical protein
VSILQTVPRRGHHAIRAVSALARVALCALIVHGLAYRSFSPADGMHSYFGAYELSVTALSALAIALFVSLLVAAAIGRVPEAVRTSGRCSPLAASAALAAATLIWLAAQETLERSLAAGGVRFVVIAPKTWLLVLVAVAALSYLLTLLSRAGAALVRAIGQPREPVGRRAGPSALLRRVSPSPRRRSPLADCRGLRAPPSPTV